MPCNNNNDNNKNTLILKTSPFLVLFCLSFFLNIFVEFPKYLNACSYNHPPLST